MEALARRRGGPIAGLVRSIPRRDSFVAVHSFFELRRGMEPGRANASRLRFIERLGEHARILPFERRAALLAGAMAAVLDSEGNRIPEIDLCIAASTLVWGDGVIVTRDVEHFGRLARFGLRVQPPGTDYGAT